MLHEIIEKLESVPATLVGGIFLIASFVFSILLSIETSSKTTICAKELFKHHMLEKDGRHY